jgi:hypothetical protein
MKGARIGLRLMLLLVALCAVIFAWVGARRQLHRINVRGELSGFQLYRENIANHRQSFTSEQGWRATLAQLDAAVAERRKALGEAEPR